MTLSLKTSGDFDSLCEISFVRNLDDIAPAALKVLSKDWCDVFNFSRAVE